jgi:glycerophosphoryl diester phosphodiesterase family protein
MSDDIGGFSAPPPPPPPSAGGGGQIPARGLGEILSTAFEVYKVNAAKLLVVVAVVVVPLALINSFLINVVFAPTKVRTVAGTIESRSTFATLMVSVLALAFAALMSFLVQAAVTRAAAQATVGDPVDVEQSYRWALSRVGAVFVVALLSFLIILGGLILFIIPGIIFSIMLAVAIPALVIEDKRGTDAISRSWNLVKGHFWHVLVVIIVAGLITSIISGILSAIGGDNWFLSWVLSAVGWIITVPFSAIVAVLLYVDLRARSEMLTGETLRADLARSA